MSHKILSSLLSLLLTTNLFVSQVFADDTAGGNEINAVQPSLTTQGLDAWHRGDFVYAIELLDKADKLGDIEATIALAKLYHYSSEFELAVPLLQKAMDKKDQVSMLMLVEYFEKGQGMEKPDVDKARQILDSLILQNYLPAIMFRGEVLESGRLGYEVDFKLAFNIIYELTDKDYHPAVKKLYNAYRYGGLGIDPDKVAAEKWRIRVRELEKLKREAKNDK